MHSRHRDGLLALGVLGVLLGIAVWLGRLDALARLPVLLVGAAGALALELVLAWYPERSRDLWAKRSVRVGSTLLVVAVGIAARVAGAVVGGWVLGLLVGGLLGYLVLLGLVLAGVVPGAESWFAR